MKAKRNTLPVVFRDDSITRVSRQTLALLADTLGFDQTQTVHLALARLREDVLGSNAKSKSGGDDYPPLTAKQLAAIRTHEPKLGKEWRQLTSKSLF